MADPTVENSPDKQEEDVLTDVKSKAALVVVSLGADRASQIYKYRSWARPPTTRWSLRWMSSINFV